MSATFRLATLNDTLFIAALLRRGYKRDGEIYSIPYDHESCILSIEDTINRGVVMVGPDSCAGALIVQFPVNFRFLVAQVHFWRFGNNKEAVIFDALLSECAKRGASMVNSASLAPNHGGRKFYARRGMRFLEAHHFGVNPEFACLLKEEGAEDRCDRVEDNVIANAS